MQLFVLKSFPYSTGPAQPKNLPAGQSFECPDDLAPGLIAAGLVTDDYDTITKFLEGDGDLENKMLDGAPEGANDEPEIAIPEDWAELGWPDLLKLANAVSEDVVKTKDEAFDAINAELAARGKTEPED